MFKLTEAIPLARFLLDATGPKHGPGFELNRILGWLASNPEHPNAELVKASLAECPGYLAWSLVWARNGLQRVQMGHRLARSLMATHVDDAEAMTCAPWDAYVIEIPPDVVHVPVGGAVGSFDAVGGWHQKGVAPNFLVLSRDLGAVIAGQLIFPLPDLIDFSRALSQQDNSPARAASRPPCRPWCEGTTSAQPWAQGSSAGSGCTRRRTGGAPRMLPSPSGRIGLQMSRDARPARRTSLWRFRE
jgi:hypothetical protein